MIYNIGTSSQYVSSNGFFVYHYIYSDSEVKVVDTQWTVREPIYGLENIGNNLYRIYWVSTDMDWGTDSEALYQRVTFTVRNTANEQISFNFSQYDCRSDVVFDNEYLFVNSQTENMTVFFRAFLTFSLNATASGCVSVVSQPTLIREDGDTGFYSVTISTNGSGSYGALEINGTPSTGLGRFSFSGYLPVVKVETVVFPCWRDTYFNYYGTDTAVEYALFDERKNVEIFKGKAYSLDGSVRIPVNKIAQSYLYSSFNPATAPQNTWIEDTTASLLFSLRINDEVKGVYFTWLDYSYEETPIKPVMILNNPVRRRCETNGYMVFSVVNTRINSDIITIEGRKTGNLLWDDPAGNGIGVYHLVFKEMNIFGDIYDYQYTQMPLWFTQYSFLADTTCYRYQFIYKNNNGGYDTFMIEGKDKKTDNWTNYSIKKTYRNTTSEFRTQHYAKDVTTKRSLYTGWLTDEESLRMDNLFESTQVYLYDLEERKVSPVIITDTSWEEKTYSNQGKQLVAYTINVEYSQNKVRR